MSNFKRFVFIFSIFILTGSLFAQEEEPPIGYTNYWFIAKYNKDKIVQEKDIMGPYYSKDQAIAIWAYKKLPERKKYCLSKNYSYVTNSPSTFYKKLYDQIFKEIKENETAAIHKYNLNEDEARNLELKKEFEDEFIAKKEAKKTGNKTQTIQPSTDNAQEKTDSSKSEVNPAVIQNTSSNQIQSTDTTNQQTNSIVNADSASISQNSENASTVVQNTDLSKTESDSKIETTQLQNIQEDKDSKNTEIPFSFNLDTASSVSRFKKEYLQDYIPQEEYVPEEKFQKQNVLIKNPNEVDSNGRTQLMLAAKSGNDWQINNLIHSGADINLQDKDGWTALMYAVRYQESVSIVKTLLNANADVKISNNYDSNALILAACYNNNPEILNLLMNYYSTSEKEVLKALVILLSAKQISEYSQIAKLNIFLNKSVPLNSFYNGKTPLMYAAQFGKYTSVIKLLLDNDALTGIRSSEGKTAFEYADQNKSLVHDEIYWSLNKK